MCRSVPPTPTRLTRSSTSPAPRTGCGRSCASSFIGDSQTTVSTVSPSTHAVELLVDRRELAGVGLNPLVDPRLQLGLALAHADAQRKTLHHELDLGLALGRVLAHGLDQRR